jgi:hypothetical protein
MLEDDVFYFLCSKVKFEVTLKEQLSLPGLYKEALNCKLGLLASR